MTPTLDRTIEDAALSCAAAAVRAARVDAITPGQAGTAYDERLARAAIEAYLSAETSRMDAESFDLRRFSIEVHAGRDIRASLSEAYARLPICPLLALVQGAWQEIDALTGMIIDAAMPSPSTVAEERPKVYRLIGNPDPSGRLICEGSTVYELERSEEGVVVSNFANNPAAERLSVPEAMLKPLERLPTIDGPAVEEAAAYLDSFDTDGADTAHLLVHYHALKMAALRERLSPHALGQRKLGQLPE